ncbi:hypothetical protein SASPL_146687 [Salvia splendens]|uniref:peptidylprolyl isomerase n=1 Tax=Salvia splendens TaxID=180675 RepID=A0A8X8WCK9_SALSN|nr:hypothetical protein SASPL_146687 [Salvia splendens]
MARHEDAHMRALRSGHPDTSSPAPHKLASPTSRSNCIKSSPSTHQFKPLCSQKPNAFESISEQRDWFSSIKNGAISVALAVGLLGGFSDLGSLESANAAAIAPAFPDVSVLISGPPIKDPGALLRYALPIDNKAMREVQKPLEDITDSLKIAGVKALDSVERNVRQASRALKEGRTMIVKGLAKSKVDDGIAQLNKLEAGFDEMMKIVEDRNRDGVAPKQKELLNYVGGVEEDMVDGFPYEVPEEYKNMPLLKGRATVDMKVKVKDNPNLEECVFRIVLDGYNAPVTSGNFVDLVERHFYDGMEIQRGNGWLCTFSRPQGCAFIYMITSTIYIPLVPYSLTYEGEALPSYFSLYEKLGYRLGMSRLPIFNSSTLSVVADRMIAEGAQVSKFTLLKTQEQTNSSTTFGDAHLSVFVVRTATMIELAAVKVFKVGDEIRVGSGRAVLTNWSGKKVQR